MEQTILEWYQKNHKFIDAPCNGKGNCGRCKVQFLKEAPIADEAERKLLTQAEIEQGIRLACRTKMPESEDFKVIGETFEKTSSVYREAKGEASYGIAFDLGSTTLAMQLIGLTSGKEYITVTSANHQRVYGADVISRIQAANDGKLESLQIMIQKDMASLLEEIVDKTGIDVAKIQKIAIAGNTTMCHLLLGYSCEGLGRAPFSPVSLTMHKCKSAELLNKISKLPEKLSGLQATVIILPGISAFVGADIVAGIYACNMDKEDTPHMLIDIGTNGEMVLGDVNGFLVASTAAGPVFEGGAISCGMPAVKGAVSHVDSLGLGLQVIGETKPEGFCGSGLIDLVALLRRAGIIDENGTLCDAYFDQGFQLEGLEEKEKEKLILTQADIRELQMGKAAIRAGMELLYKNNIPEKIYLAGGFGTAIDLRTAAEIGLFSKEAVAKVIPVGNTVLKGLQKFLTEEEGERRVQNIPQKATEVLLAKETTFEETYIEYMQFDY